MTTRWSGPAMPGPGRHYDVVIIGGALSGAATAVLLMRGDPSLKVLIIEKSAAFGRRVGEATVEISGYFLCRVLGLTGYLNENHLVKQGMRFWFTSPQVHSLADCSELGPRYLARVPAFQVDRAALDEQVLDCARKAGAEIWRTASVSKTVLSPGGIQRVEVRRGDENITVTSAWIVDASGVAALLARQEGWWRQNKAHPTTAVWARWTGVKDWDSQELAQKFPDWAQLSHGIRNTATNHVVGDGWWAWCIPLKGGDVSVGVVFDQRFVEWPEGGSMGQRLKDFLLGHPATREIMADAQWKEGDVHWRKNLPYYSTRMAGDGFVLVGDAAGFIDPFYSPGMDWVSFTSFSAANMILQHRKGEEVAPLAAKHDRDFSRSYERWFDGVYRNKYEYMCEFDLMSLAFQLDLGFYYGGVAIQAYKRGTVALLEPVYSTGPSAPFYWLMRSYNRRFATMARRRRAKGLLGRHNAHGRALIPGFSFAKSARLSVFWLCCSWAMLELKEGWRTWFRDVPAERHIEVERGEGAATAEVAVAKG